MNLKAVYEGGAPAWLKSGEMARPRPAARQAWKMATEAKAQIIGEENSREEKEDRTMSEKSYPQITLGTVWGHYLNL